MHFAVLFLIVVAHPVLLSPINDDQMDKAVDFSIAKGKEIFPGKRVGFYRPVLLDGPKGTKPWSSKWTWDIEIYVDDDVCPMQVVVTDDGSLAVGSPKNTTCKSLNPHPQQGR